ncbi:hypothetical protein A1O1_06018 [Capronia coronata CBS 617.96]|uniref:Uncharacterized protein n=1 Tax=Capronia coronata CBS 617.96 TaxID=1182541 RepID=W9XYM1_9EURO|nr:uncharacterized protein A1O1_06018 [Capronia coronata CBS 617.96]EXJ85652.1 hypothetical protein A1O1_06018 [Capronia coronata CBS 617.96]
MASESWYCLRLNLLDSTYLVQDLGDLTPKGTSVMPVDAPEVRLSDEIIRSGLVERTDPDDDDYLYMGQPPSNTTGRGHEQSLEDTTE